MSVEFENKIFDYLVNLGCCKLCCLRYLNVRDEGTYVNIDEFISNRNIIINKETKNEDHNKKIKCNPCIACLGLLQDFVVSDIVQNCYLDNAKEYDCKHFTCSVSMPVSIILREHLLKIELQKKFPEFFEEGINETLLNKAWKNVIKDKLALRTGKTFVNSDTCDFSVNVTLEYDLEHEELSVLQKIAPEHFAARAEQRRKYSGEMYTRKDILNLLEQIKENDLRNVCTIPPEVSSKYLKCKSIDFKHNPIYLAGRYCKYSRELSQSPWIIDGVKTMETSVQEIIFQKIHGMFNIPIDNLKFAASGREDCDVRCLGRGRPFYIEIIDPKITTFTFDQFRELERHINTSALIKVKDLQVIQKHEIAHIKEGEECKTKKYVALCIANGSVTDDQIEAINRSAPLEILQKTPIRVLHRRPLTVRKKNIYEMTAKKIQGRDHVFELHVVTQAGTYIKEFVHGDFDRTVPNIGKIIGVEVDIIALDVIAINLDWPNPVNYEYK